MRINITDVDSSMLFAIKRAFIRAKRFVLSLTSGKKEAQPEAVPLSSKEARRQELIQKADAVIKAIAPSLDFRSRVLEKALALEYLTSLILAERLDIDMSKSILFGGTTRALTFNERFRLLREITAIEKDDRTRLDILGEVRNKIAHDARVLTITDALPEPRRVWMMPRYGGDKQTVDPILVEAAFFKMADELIVKVKESLGTGIRHSERAAETRLVELRFYAHTNGLTSGTNKTLEDINQRIAVKFQWDPASIAMLPIITAKQVQVDTEINLKNAGL